MRKSYTDEDRERFRAMYATGMANREIARQLDMPESTIRKWIRFYRDACAARCAEDAECAAVRTERTPVDLDQLRTEKKVEFIENAWTLIGKSVRLADARVTRALEHEDALDEMIGEVEASGLAEPEKRALIAKLGELQIQHVRELATLIGVMYDKAALAMGDPTSNIGGDAFRVQIEVLDE